MSLRRFLTLQYGRWFDVVFGCELLGCDVSVLVDFSEDSGTAYLIWWCVMTSGTFKGSQSSVRKDITRNDVVKRLFRPIL